MKGAKFAYHSGMLFANTFTQANFSDRICEEVKVSIPRLRRYLRVKNPDGISVDYTEGGHLHGAIVRDLGAGGAFIGTHKVIAPNGRLSLLFYPSQNRPAVKAEARVRYQIEGEGCGVEFTKIPLEYRKEILSIIMKHLLMGKSNSGFRFVTQVEYPGGMFLGFSMLFSEDELLVQTDRTLATGSIVTVRFRENYGDPLVVARGEVFYAIKELGFAMTLKSQKCLSASSGIQ